MLAEQLAASPDELVAARAADVAKQGAVVLTELGEVVDRIPPASALLGAVLVADELGPGEVARAVEACPGDHRRPSVLVGGNLGVPMVLGVGQDLNSPAGAILDVKTERRARSRPTCLTSPNRRQAVAEAAERSARQRELAAAPVEYRRRPIRVVANIGSVAEAHAAVAATSADGVGLLRAEVPDHRPPADYPDEDILEVLGWPWWSACSTSAATAQCGAWPSTRSTTASWACAAAVAAAPS